MSLTSPSTTLYTLGSGILQIALWSGGVPGAYEDLGNAPSVELTLALEEKEHKESRSAAKSVDKSIVVERGYNVKFTLDEISTANLRRWVMGSGSGSNISGLLATDDEFSLKFKADNAAGPNRIYEFHRCSIRPDGGLALIGDDWQGMSYTAKGLKDAANNPSSPYFDITSTTTSTMTTTTTTTEG